MVIYCKLSWQKIDLCKPYRKHLFVLVSVLSELIFARLVNFLAVEKITSSMIVCFKEDLLKDIRTNVRHERLNTVNHFQERHCELVCVRSRL